MGCKKQGAKNRVIVIQKEKRPFQGHKPNRGCRLTGQLCLCGKMGENLEKKIKAS